MGTQKNHLDETVLLGTQNICLKLRVGKYLQFYAQKFCLSKPILKNDLVLASSADPDKMKHGAFYQGHYCLAKYPLRGFQSSKD